MIRITLSLLIFFTSSVHAQGTSTGFAYLGLLFPGRTAALSEATVADPTSLSSFSLNPSLLSQAGSVEVSLTHTQWFAGVQAAHLSAGIPITFGGLGLSISSTSIRNIEIREVPGPLLGSFDTHATTLTASLAIAADTNISLGATFKYLYEKIYVDEALGWGADLGILYRLPIDGLTGALAFTDLGQLNKLRNQSAAVPSRLRLGTAYQFSLNDIEFLSALAISRELNRNLAHWHLGVEAMYHESFALRLGYQTGYQARGFSIGTGVAYLFARFDYTFLPIGYSLGNAHIATLGFRF